MLLFHGISYRNEGRGVVHVLERVLEKDIIAIVMSTAILCMAQTAMISGAETVANRVKL